MPNDQFTPDRLTHMTALQSAGVIAQLKYEIGAFSKKTARRGRRYYENAQVGHLESTGSSVTAEVYGTSSYTTSWHYDDGYWHCECTCPIEFDCKHAYALALEMLALSPGESTGQRAGEPTAFYMSTPGRPDLRAYGGAPPRRAAGGFTSASEALAALREAVVITGRAQALEYLVAGGLVSRGSLHFQFRDELQESDPDLRCWRLAESLASRGDGRVPEELMPFLERADLRERIFDQRRQRLTGDLVEWAGKPVRNSKRSVRLVLNVEALQYRDGLVVTCTPYQTSARFDDAPRTVDQIRPFLTEIEHGKVVVEPEQHAVLSWLVHGVMESYGSAPQVSAVALRTIDRFSDSAMVTWAEEIEPNLAARAGITPGGSVAASPCPARLVPTCRALDGEAVLGLGFQWLDGGVRPLGEGLRVVAPAHNYGDFDPFVIADGAISPIVDEPPHAVVSQFQELGHVNVTADVRVPLLRALGKRYPHILEALEEHTAVHPAIPVVALDLRDDDWLQVRVFAAPPESEWIPGEPSGDDTIFELHPESGWSRAAADARPGYSEIDSETDSEIDSEDALELAAAAAANQAGSPPRAVAADSAVEESPAPDAAVWNEAPEAAAVEPIIDWLDVLKPGSGDKRKAGSKVCPWRDSSIGWWLPITRSGASRFAEAWAVAPRRARFYGTEAVRRLLSRKHRAIASLRVHASGVDWFEVSAEWQAEGLQLTEHDLDALRKAKSEFVKLPSGWVRRDTTEELDRAANLMADLGVEIGRDASRLSLFELAGAKPETLRALEELGDDRPTFDAVRALRERIKAFDGIPRVRKPRRFKGTLRPYQRDGLDFLAYTGDLGLGAILADDMGLGKTIQALVWLQSQHDSDPTGGPALVVCPASVTDNWLCEAAQFTPKLKVMTLDRGRERLAQLERVADCDIAITNYALLRRDIERWREQPLRALILDEAQNVKNPDAATTRAVQSLDARFRLALTGTPLENRLLDLWSIVQCVNPGYLGARSAFAQSYDRLDLPEHRRTLLAAKLRPILLRRTKARVAPDLPDRIEESRRCEMTKGQRQLYLAELARSRRLVAELSEDAAALQRNKISILAALTRLRQICCHPALTGGKKTLGSGKFDTLFEVLEPLLAEGHKVLLFSQFVKNLELLRAEMGNRGIGTHMLTGKTTKRGAVIDGFQNDPDACVFLISLKAGGTGLNLTSASYVVLFDPWWNPAVEAQAIDRTHRIGQDRTVIAYRLITTGTIEEKILELQQRKRGLAEDILGEAGFARSLDSADLEYILEAP